MKLLKEIRGISVHSRRTGKMKYEMDIDVQLEDLLKIIKPNVDDPRLYDGYELNEDKFEFINNLLKEKIKPDFIKHEYFLICSGTYDWDSK